MHLFILGSKILYSIFFNVCLHEYADELFLGSKNSILY